MNALRIPGDFDNIKVLNPHGNLDYWYGPYDTLAEAIEVTLDVKALGLTVGVNVDGKLVEYWWQNGANNTLVLVEKARELEWE